LVYKVDKVDFGLIRLIFGVDEVDKVDFGLMGLIINIGKNLAPAGRKVG
jgi:hypothetical protein